MIVPAGKARGYWGFHGFTFRHVGKSCRQDAHFSMCIGQRVRSEAGAGRGGVVEAWRSGAAVGHTAGKIRLGSELDPWERLFAGQFNGVSADALNLDAGNPVAILYQRDLGFTSNGRRGAGTQARRRDGPKGFRQLRIRRGFRWRSASRRRARKRGRGQRYKALGHWAEFVFITWLVGLSSTWLPSWILSSMETRRLTSAAGLSLSRGCVSPKPATL